MRKTAVMSRILLPRIVLASCISMIVLMSIFHFGKLEFFWMSRHPAMSVTPKVQSVNNTKATLRECTQSYSRPQWTPNKITSRNLADFEDMIPDFVGWKNLLNRVSFGSVLEIGTGAGRALLDLKSIYPFAQVYGTNYKQYGYSQIEGSNESMWNVSTYFNVRIHCDQSGNPMFPTIIGLGKIQHEWLPFPSEWFDLIFSRHSLNDGKLEPQESHCFVPRVHKVLKSEGMALLHLLWDTGPVSPTLANFTDSAQIVRDIKNNEHKFLSSRSLPKTDTILLVTNVVDHQGKRTSIILFETSGSCGTGPRNNTKFCVGMIMKKCAPAEPLHRRYRDCILPNDIQFAPHGFIKAEQIQLTVDWRIDYHKKYLANLIEFLKQWSHEGHFHLNDTGAGACIQA